MVAATKHRIFEMTFSASGSGSAGKANPSRVARAVEAVAILEDFGNLELRGLRRQAWQRDLSVGDEKIGDVLAAQGDTTGALAVYRESLAIAKVLAAKDSGNTLLQRDLSAGNNNIGGMLKIQGDFAGALVAYRDSLAITKALAQKDPGNVEWQRDLAVDEESIGDVLKAQGDLAGALAAYRDRLLIAQALAQKDPNNMPWQRDLAVVGHKIGNVLIAQGNLDGAVVANREAVAIVRRAYAAHPAVATVKEELARAIGGLSWVLLLANRPRKALDGTQEALTLDPSLLFVRTNQAHALLLLGHFDAVKAIYVEDKNKPRDSGKTLAAIVRDDFAELRKFGIDTPTMKRIEALISS
jgi:tetratricopeptide (TPR) repeat protein